MEIMRFLQIIDDNGTSCRKKQIRKSVVSFPRSLHACVNAKGGQFRLTLLHGLVNLVINISIFNDN